jgi:lipoprotein-anchoring transpeptidase ErfK/SrfK
MIDYYPYLLRAVQAADAADPEVRRDVYIRAWQIVTDQLRVRQPPVSDAELRAFRSGFQTAVERIEREYSGPTLAPAPRHSEPEPPAVEIAPDLRIQPDERPPRSASQSRRSLWGVAVVAVLILGTGIGGYVVWTTWTDSATRTTATPTAINHEAALREPLLRRKPTVAPSTAELAPGVDGGSTDADLPLVFRRQRVFYRTTFPPGTIVVDKPQHFAYLVLPNSAALRYGIGVGAPCAELAGLKRIARKAEWPEWTPPAGSGRAGPLPGGPGNPLGARLLDLDDNIGRIHGTNAPKTIGDDVALGCVRLVNDDVADLYNRVPVGTGVVMR